MVNKSGFPDKGSVASWQAQMRQAMFEALDQDAIREVVAAMLDRAKKGDIQAARLLLTYAVGSPTVNVKNAVFVDGQRAPLPSPPTRALPRTNGKLEALGRRAANGNPLFDPRDARHGDGDDE